MNNTEITVSDLYAIAGFDAYRAIASNLEHRAEADRIFEETKDLKAVDEYCKQVLKIPFLNKLMKESNIDKRFQSRTFENYNAYNDALIKAKKQAFDYSEKISEHLKSGTNLIFSGFGCVGTGKTHLACAIAQEVTKKDIPAKFINVTSMVAELKEKFNIFEYVNVDLLIIDDMGKEKGTEWVCEQIYTIINKRYEKMLPTVLTTESTLEVLRQGYGAKGNAIVSRLIENYILIKMSGEDYRNRKVRQVYGGKHD